jgi:hypothetical protein
MHRCSSVNASARSSPEVSPAEPSSIRSSEEVDHLVDYGRSFARAVGERFGAQHLNRQRDPATAAGLWKSARQWTTTSRLAALNAAVNAAVALASIHRLAVREVGRVSAWKVSWAGTMKVFYIVSIPTTGDTFSDTSIARARPPRSVFR